MRRTLLAALALAVAAATLAAAVPASAATIDVFPGESIQDAVSAASPGDVIVVHAGVYNDVVSIKTDGITIQGEGATADGTVLMPPDSEVGRCGKGIAGFCMLGFRTADGVLSDVTISGFLVQDFPEFGIVAVDTENMVFSDNAAVNNGVYGITAFSSTGTQMLNNVATGNEETGLYIGDSTNADATLDGNEAFGNGNFGILLRDAAVGTVTNNQVHGNCVGIVVLNTGEAVNARDWLIQGNEAYENNAFCPGGDEGPSTSGIGVAIVGSGRITVTENSIHDNQPAKKKLPFHGGVVVIAITSKKPSHDNEITDNILCDNKPNVFWDGAGTGNVFERNDCLVA